MPAAVTDRALLLTADRAWTGDPASVPPGPAAVLLQGAVIRSLGADALADPLAAAARRIDLPGCTLLPGLIDAHVHLALPGDGTPFAEFVREPAGVQAAVAVRNAAAALAAGITTLRDCGGPERLTFELRRAAALGYAAAPHLHLCGRPLTIRGGHCWYFGGECGGRDGVAEMVRQVCKEGADFVKVMGSGGGTPGTLSHRPAFTPAEMARAADEAHRLQRRLAVHCLNAEATRQALAAGADVIEHAQFLTGPAGANRLEMDVVEALARSGASVCPTLAVSDAWLGNLRARGETGPERERWERMREANLTHTAALVREGVPLIAGTDAGWRTVPFDALAQEVAILHEAGLDTQQALCAATSSAAAALGLQERTGRLQPGLCADVIAVAGDPLRDLGALGRVALVVRAGELVRGPAAERPRS